MLNIKWYDPKKELPTKNCLIDRIIVAIDTKCNNRIKISSDHSFIRNPKVDDRLYAYIHYLHIDDLEKEGKKIENVFLYYCPTAGNRFEYFVWEPFYGDIIAWAYQNEIEEI